MLVAQFIINVPCPKGGNWMCWTLTCIKHMGQKIDAIWGCW